MENEEQQSEKAVGEMHKQPEMMPDGERYIIYYTFEGETGKSSSEIEKGIKENV